MEITFPVLFEPYYLLFASSQLEEDDRLLVFTRPFTPMVLGNKTAEYVRRKYQVEINFYLSRSGTSP